MKEWINNPTPLEEASEELFALKAVSRPAEILNRAREHHERAHRYIIESCHHRGYEGIYTDGSADVSDNDDGLARSSSAAASPRPRASPATPPRRLMQPRAKVRTPCPKERASHGGQLVPIGTFVARSSVGLQPCSKQKSVRTSAGLRTCPKSWPKHRPRPAANDVVVVDDDVATVDSDIDDRAVTEAMQKDVELYLSNPDGVPDNIDGAANPDGVPDDIDGEPMSGDDDDEIDEHMHIPFVFRHNTAYPTIATAGIRPPSRAPRRQRGKRKPSSDSRQHNRSSYRRLRHSAPADDEDYDDEGGDENEDKYNKMVTMMIFRGRRSSQLVGATH